MITKIDSTVVKVVVATVCIMYSVFLVGIQSAYALHDAGSLSSVVTSGNFGSSPSGATTVGSVNVGGSTYTISSAPMTGGASGPTLYVSVPAIITGGVGGGGGGDRSSDRDEDPAIAYLYVRPSGSGSWVGNRAINTRRDGGSITIGANETFDLSYRGFERCWYTNFTGESSPDPRNWQYIWRIGDSVLAPGETKRFTMDCSADGGMTRMYVTVTKESAPAVSALLRVRNTGNQTWRDVNSITIAHDETADLNWGANAAAIVCTGGNFNTGGRTSGTVSSVALPAPGSSRVYSLGCAGGGGTDADSVVIYRQAPPVTVNLRARTASNTTWQDSNVTVGPTETFDLGWNSTNATNCSFIRRGFLTLVKTGTYQNVTANRTSGALINITEVAPGTSATLRIRCTGPGVVETDTVTVTRQAAPLPTAGLSVRTNTNSTWQNINTVTITHDGTADLQWASTDATSCAGTGFNTGSGDTRSGTALAADLGLPTPGNSKTYTVTCTGSGGSAPDTVTITRSATPPTAALSVRTNTNSTWQNINTVTVDHLGSVDLKWTSTNADSCTGTGPGFSTGAASAPSGTDTTITLPAPGASQAYTLNCTGAGGSAPDTVTVTRRAEANLTVHSLTTTKSTAFNSTTGVYNSVTVSGIVRNSGASPAPASQYRITLTDSKGTKHVKTGNTPLRAAGTDSTASQSFPSIPFGPYTVELEADIINTVQESNENDNSISLTDTLAPPPPALQINTPSPIVRRGSDVVVSWDTDLTYSMDCSLSGPSLPTLSLNPRDTAAAGEITFDPSISGATGSATSVDISAIRTFTLTCTEPITSTVFPSVSVRVEVVPAVQEI